MGCFPCETTGEAGNETKGRLNEGKQKRINLLRIAPENDAATGEFCPPLRTASAGNNTSQDRSMQWRTIALF